MNLLVALSLARAASPADGPTVIFPLRAVNLAADEVEKDEVGFRSAWSKRSARTMEPWSTMVAAMTGAEDTELAATCARLQCAEWVTVDLVGLGDEVFLTAVLKSPNGEEQQRVELTSPLADLGANLDRAAMALAWRIPFDQTGGGAASRPSAASSPSTVAAPAPSSAIPEPAPPRAAARATTAAAPVTKERMRQGMLVGVRLPTNGYSSASVSTAWAARIPARHFDLDVSAGVAAPGDLASGYVLAYFDVGLLRNIPVGPVDLYTGGGVGPRIGAAAVDSGIGLGAYALFGIAGPRDGLGQLRLQARLAADGLYGFSYGYLSLNPWWAIEQPGRLGIQRIGAG